MRIAEIENSKVQSDTEKYLLVRKNLSLNLGRNYRRCKLYCCHNACKRF